MREMKDSGIEWIGDVPQSWQLVRIKVCISRRDSGAWGEEATGEPGDCICIRVADMDYDRLRLKDNLPFTYRNYEEKVIESLKLADGDILIEKSGGGEKTLVGRAVMFRGTIQAVFANFMERIRCCDFVSSRFLLYILAVLYQSGYIKNYIKQTTGIQNLDISSMFSKEYLALPSIAVQDRITHFLDRKCSQIDALIARQQEVIEKLKAYKLSVITEAVTKGLNPDVPMKDSGVEWIGKIPQHWKMVRLKFLLSQLIDCPHETPAYNADGDYLVIRTADQDLGKLREDKDMYRLDEGEYRNRIRRMPLEKDDIVYGREGERWGLACLVPESNKYCLGQRMLQFRCKNELFLPSFAMWALNSKFVYLQGEVDTIGSTSPHVNISTVRNVLIPVPSINEQQEIAEYVDKKMMLLDRELNHREFLIRKFNDYKKSLIYEVVTGKREV